MDVFTRLTLGIIVIFVEYLWPIFCIYFGVQASRVGAKAIFQRGATIDGRRGVEHIDPLIGIGVLAMGIGFAYYGFDMLFFTVK
jgi:hypothetical protein